MNALNSELKAQAIDAGLCQQWQNGWQRSKSPQELIRMFKEGIDFCINNDYPSNEFILQNFDKSLLIDNGVFVDCKGINTTGSGIYVVQGDSDISVRVGDYEVVTMYVRHNGVVNIDVADTGMLFVHTYDNASVNISKVGRAKVFEYRH